MNELIDAATWRRIQEKYGITGSPADFILEKGWLIGRWHDAPKPEQDGLPPFRIAANGWNASGNTFEELIEDAMKNIAALDAKRKFEWEDRVRSVSDILAGKSVIPLVPYSLEKDTCVYCALRFFHGIEIVGDSIRRYSACGR